MGGKVEFINKEGLTDTIITLDGIKSRVKDYFNPEEIDLDKADTIRKNLLIIETTVDVSEENILKITNTASLKGTSVAIFERKIDGKNVIRERYVLRDQYKPDKYIQAQFLQENLKKQNFPVSILIDYQSKNNVPVENLSESERRIVAERLGIKPPKFR
jgi:hypothetical protein